MTIAFLPEER